MKVISIVSYSTLVTMQRQRRQKSRQMGVSLLFMITLTAAYSGADFISKCVCSGESVILAENISLGITGSAVSLYVNGYNQTLIAMWMKTDSKITEKYSHKVSYDGDGNVWIRNMDISDEAKYIILHETGVTPNKVYEVQLTVLVAPTQNCKPKIKRIGNTLIASLESAECGRPEATVYFVQYPDISYENKTMAMLYPGQESGTYTACIETPAVRCARISKPSDFCSYFQIHTNTNQDNKEGSTNTYAVIILSVVAALCFLFAVLEYVIPRVCRGSNVRSSSQSQQDNMHEWACNLCYVSQERQQQLQTYPSPPANGTDASDPMIQSQLTS